MNAPLPDNEAARLVALSKYEKSLNARVNQQAAVAKLGQLALEGCDLYTLMDEAVALVIQSLEVEYCELLELIEDGKSALLRAGGGWQEGLVGYAKVSTDINSQAGYILFTKEPLIVENHHDETRFSGYPLLEQHQVISSLSVIIIGQDMPYGILGAHTTKQRIFLQDDINFLQSIANVLAQVISRKFSEQTLQGSLKNLADLKFALDQSSIVAITDSSGIITYVNDKFCEISKYSRVELLGQNYRIINSGYHSKEFFRSLWETITSGEVWKGQIKNRAKDGTFYWIETTIVPLLNSRRQPEQYVAIHNDITERKRAEQALQQSVTERQQIEQVLRKAKDELEIRVAERTAELISVNEQLQAELDERKRTQEALRMSQARFAGILDIADDAIISVDINQHITLFNQGAEKIFGYAVKEVLGQPLDLLLPLQYSQVHHQHIMEFASSCGKARRMGERKKILARRKDGTEFPAEASISKLELGEETVFTVILRDITTNLQSQEALERLSRQNGLILNSMGEGLCGLDKSGRITFVNSAGAKLLGYNDRELIGQSIEIILSHSNSDGVPYSLTNSPIYASLSDASVHQVSNEVFRRKNNSSFSVEYVSTPIKEQGEVKGAVITFKDITDRQIVERMKDEFISVVSHELRTPLTSIHGSLGMLASGLVDPTSERGKRLLAIAVDSTERLVRLVNDILDIERIKSGQETMVKYASDAADLMTEAIDVMQAMAQQYDVNLSVSFVSVQLWVDRDRILQTLTNLLSNAIKFSRPKSTVWLSAKCQENYIIFQVKDQGRGIPSDKLEAIFERFQQVDASDSRLHEGTGLGLAICRSIVQQHSGRIWVESELGKGSTFYFSLPILIVPESPRNKSREQ